MEESKGEYHNTGVPQCFFGEGACCHYKIFNINIKIIATVILASVNATTQECHGTFYEMVGVVIVIVSR